MRLRLLDAAYQSLCQSTALTITTHTLLIMRPAQWAYRYARDVVRGPWPEAEGV
jgi:hypothetical protein